MGSALISDLLFNFYAKDKVLNRTEISTLNILSGIVWYGLLGLVISGFMLFFSDPSKYLISVKFIAKMSVLFVLVVNGYLLSKKIWPHLRNKKFLVSKKEKKFRRWAFIGGTVSIVSWFTVLTLGVIKSSPLSYLGIIGLYFLILLIAIPVALAIEKREFN